MCDGAGRVMVDYHCPIHIQVSVIVMLNDFFAAKPETEQTPESIPLYYTRIETPVVLSSE